MLRLPPQLARLSIPRPKGRGLIEATAGFSPAWSGSAPIPRPKGRGLIEAVSLAFTYP